MPKQILILGGYGGVGKVIAKLLLEQTDVNIVIAGRRKEKAEELASKLNNNRVKAAYADTSDAESLRKAFKNINLVVVCTTSPHDIPAIAKMAMKFKIDYLDIQFEPKVSVYLKSLEKEINQTGNLFITKAGFHPGLPAAFIREGAKYFDKFDKATIAMAMNSKFNKPESLIDLINSVRNFKAHLFRGKTWRKANYKDIIKVDFGTKVGVKKCYPIEMEEIKEMTEAFNLSEAGVYVCGFNWFVDNLVFPLIVISHLIKKNSLTKPLLGLTYWGINTFSKKKTYVVFLLHANGLKNNRNATLELKAWHHDPYFFTAVPVVACIKQYLGKNLVKNKGLAMMGHIVNAAKLLKDMEKMGIKININFKYIKTRE